MKNLDNFKIAALAFTFLLIGFQTNAAADGFYFGAGTYQSEAKVDSLDDSDATLGFLVGYHLIDSSVFMLSAELGSYDLGEYSIDGIDVDADAIALSASAGLPLGPFIELYGKIGIAEVSLDVNGDSSDGSESFYGAGIAFDILDTIDIYVEYLEFDTEVDSSLVGVGIKLDLF
ncbi:MAG: outer membrane beta-barrel protein [Gammaproteobacteria bacterium]|nr:outer membrane beta-barrel protein [Gammaproteobacteria bacterium]